MAKIVDWDRHIGRRLRLRDLHVFFAVVETGSLAKAAAQLNVSQPAVSQLIADMEHVLDVKLFDRSSRGVTPTAYGHVLLERGTCCVRRAQARHPRDRLPVRARFRRDQVRLSRRACTDPATGHRKLLASPSQDHSGHLRGRIRNICQQAAQSQSGLRTAATARTSARRRSYIRQPRCGDTV